MEAAAEHSVLATGTLSDQRTHLLQARDQLCRHLQVLGETLPRAAIEMAQQRYPYGISAVVLEQIAHQRQVAQGFTHLLTILVYHPRVHPETREWSFPCKVFGLRNLAGVMGEGQIFTSTVNVQLWAEVAHRHRTALNVPAGPARAPGTWPCRFARSLRLPEHKIKWVSLAGIIGEVAALVRNREHSMIIIQPNRAGHAAEFRIPFDAVVDTAAVLICKPLCEKHLDDLDHGGRLFAGMGVDIGPPDVQRVHIPQITLGLAPAQFVPRHTHFSRLAQDIIVNICHILHVLHFAARIFQVAHERIERNVGEGMPEVSSIIRRYPAHVDAHGIVYGNKFLLVSKPEQTGGICAGYPGYLLQGHAANPGQFFSDVPDEEWFVALSA